MKPYKIFIKKSAVKELKHLPKNQIKRITVLINSLSSDPRPRNCKKLKAYNNLWRIRSGDYRIIYSIDDKNKTVNILEIVKRQDAYFSKK